MATVYRKPGAYVERVKSTPQVGVEAPTGVAGFVGESFRGEPYKAIRITSYAQFEQNFALGYDDATRKPHLADAVKGFFLNGGSEAYVVRVTGNNPVKAKATVPTDGAKFTALEVGAWGNDVSVEVKQENGKLTLVVSVLGKVVETIKNLETKSIVESDFVTVEGDLKVGTGALSGGTDGSIPTKTLKAEIYSENLVANDFIKGLKCLDTATVNQIAIPGVTTTGVPQGLCTYCENRGRVMAIVDAPQGATYEEVNEFYATLSGFRVALYHPWLQTTDETTGKIKEVAPSGHVAGLYNRTDNDRGVHKAPAGVEANIRGVIGVVTELDDTTVGNLNTSNINCIIPKRGRGIVVWGARLLNQESERQFVSDLRVDDFIETNIETGTEWVVFEPIDEQLFNRVQGSLTAFMNTLMQKGVIKGSTPKEAYFVVCDESNNPDPDSSTLCIDIGYAKKKPAEFVVTRISHKRAE